MIFRVSLVVIAPSCVLAQSPNFTADGVANAASFVQPGSIAASSIVTIFGQNLATGTQSATQFPLPTNLLGSSVTVNGNVAPLLFVSPGQINFVVPNNLDMPGPNTPLEVATPGGTRGVMIRTASVPGIFTQDASGCGRGAIQNIDVSGLAILNTAQQSAAPDGYAAVYTTGLGPVYFPPADGHPAPTDPLPRTLALPIVMLGLPGFKQLPASVLYSGRAPGLAGVDQINFRIPADTSQACNVPISVRNASGVSQVVTMSIRAGQSRCDDSPGSSIGALRWQRTQTSGPQAGAETIQERFVAWMIQAPGTLLRTDEGQQWMGPSDEPGTFPPSGRCAVPGVAALSAGRLTLRDAAGQIYELGAGTPAAPTEPAYSMALPAGTIRQGTFRATSSGSSVQAFQSEVTIPAPLRITTPLQPGTLIDTRRPFQLAWTNRDEGALVRVRIISYIPAGGLSMHLLTAMVTAGTVTLPLLQSGDRMTLPLLPADDAEIFVTVEPTSAQTQAFRAAGLSLGGTHSWQYVYRFRGLRIAAGPSAP